MDLTLSLAPDHSRVSLGDAYLQLQLGSHLVALPIETVQQTQLIPAQRIAQIPNMPAPILGLVNLRSRVFWVVNLSHMLELPALDLAVGQYQLVVIQVEQAALGLLVQEIKGITRFSRDSIESPVDAVASNLVPYLKGCVWRQEKCLFVLDAAAIANSSALHRSNLT